MIIHIDEEELEVMEDDASTLYRSLMAKPVLTLKFSLPYWKTIPVNSWVEFWNEKYYLTDEPTIKKNNTRNIEYTLTMSTDVCKLELYKLHNMVDYRLKWSMCAKPHEFIEEIVKNINERVGDGVWSVGECIEANEKTIEFNHTNLFAALQSVADTFETEWEIENNTINLKKVEYFKDAPTTLSYGKGNGFVAGVGRTVVSGEKPIKRLYVQGGETNIDRSKYYNSPCLLLPKSQSLVYDGRTYTTDKNGYYIERTDKVTNAEKEDSLDCDEIYPKRVGEVFEVIVDSEAKNFYDFTDTSIPADLDYNNCLIAGEKAYIRFQSGMLAGEKDFEFQYVHKERKFKLVPQEIDGVTMPNKTFIPKVGDTYAVFGISLPQAYISDNATQTGAEWEMFKAAAKHLRENEDQKFTFSGELQSIWAKNNWGRIGGMLKVGSYVNFVDNQFATEGVKIRITGIRYNLTSPHAPKLELSNESSSASIATALREIKNTEVAIDDAKKEAIRYTNRRWRDAQDTLTALEEALLNFSEGINPITVQTMAMLVGDESLQFRFVKSKEELKPISYNITYDADKAQLHCPSGFLQHMTLGIDSISSTHTDSEYKVWEMAEYSTATLDDKVRYYLYARVSTNTDEIGGFLISRNAIEMNHARGYYHLLVGILNTESSGTRSFATLYGFTEILPSQVRTDTIISSDGKTYFDLANGEIGGRIRFLNDDGRYITIIEGGKISTELIDVNNISAGRVLVGDEGGRHVLIAPDEATKEGKMSVYDEEANECLLIEGNKYTDMEDLFGEGEKGSVPIAIRTEPCYGFDSGISMGTGWMQYSGNDEMQDHKERQENIALSDFFYTYVPTDVAINTGEVFLHVSTATRNDGKEHKAYIHIQIFVETYKDEAHTTMSSKVMLVGKSVNIQSEIGKPDALIEELRLMGKSVRASRGYHRIVMNVRMQATNTNDSAVLMWGGYEDGKETITAGYDTKFFISRYFANGFCLGETTDKYLAAFEGSDRMNFVVQNKNTAFRVRDKIMAKVKTDKWMPIPVLLYKATYSVDSTKGTCTTIAMVKSFTGETLEAGWIGGVGRDGNVRLTIPETWRTYITAQDLLEMMTIVVSRTKEAHATLTTKNSDELMVNIDWNDLKTTTATFDIVILNL